MSSSEVDRNFGASIARVYQSHLVPLLFEPYAEIVAKRVAALRPARVLEIAAGTGVLTRAMSAHLGASTTIVATDLNQAMLDRAIAAGTTSSVEWRQADAMNLPFDDASFDVVVCQFGAMFFPDKPHAFSEARRVLGQSGVFLFSVWDRIEENAFAETVTVAAAALFPDDPPTFMRRTPHGYFDEARIAEHVRAAGFATPTFERIAATSRGKSPHDVAVAFCEGTPMRSEIEAHAGSTLASMTQAAEDALAEWYGRGAIEGKMQAILVSVAR